MEELAKIRKEIDVVDKEIVKMLVKRFRLVERISKVKAEHGIPLVDAERERQVLSKVRSLAEKHEVNPSLVEEIFKAIIESCKKHEKFMMNASKDYI